MTKNSFSYKQGFKKGIEIYNQNARDGYFADKNNERVMKTCKQYADTGYKNGEKLKQTQIDYYLGLYDGIKYRYKDLGTPIIEKRNSKFQEYEYNHYYAK